MGEAAGRLPPFLLIEERNSPGIFDRMVARIFPLDGERARKDDVLKDLFKNAPEPYQHTELANIKQFTMAQYRFWTTDEFISNLRKK